MSGFCARSRLPARPTLWWEGSHWKRIVLASAGIPCVTVASSGPELFDARYEECATDQDLDEVPFPLPSSVTQAGGVGAPAIAEWGGGACGSLVTSPLYRDIDGAYVVDGDVTASNFVDLLSAFAIPCGAPESSTEVYDAQMEHAVESVRHSSVEFGIDWFDDRPAIWDAAQRWNLTYCIGNGFGGMREEVVDAISAAAAAWTAVAGVAFQHVAGEDAKCDSGTASVLFRVRYNSAAPYYARAFLPRDPASMRSVFVSSGGLHPSRPLSLTGILTHELGHVLGLRHEHLRSSAAGQCSGEEGKVGWYTPYDPASVMHYPWCRSGGLGTHDLSISALDAQAVALLYRKRI